jgi:hypothetical protein
MVKLEFAARRRAGRRMRLAGDADYAERIFSAIENLPDVSLVLLAITLRDKFGLRPLPKRARAI